MDTTHIALGVGLLLICIILYYVFFMAKEDFYKYTQDDLYNVPWRWEWKKKDIINLKCHCPQCDEVLVYENDYLLHKTYFLCPSCDSQKAVIGGGDSKYAFGIVKREINRKIRTKEYKELITKV